MAAWITAIVALITFLFGFYQYYTKRKHNKLFFYMYLKRIYNCFKCNNQILENIFADEKPARALSDIIKPYKNDLHYDTQNLLEAQKYEEICRDIFSESDIERIHDYILSMGYFFNLVRTLIVASNKTISLIDYKQNLKEKIHIEQCNLFGVDKTVAFDIFYSKCSKKIEDEWTNVENIFK